LLSQHSYLRYQIDDAFQSEGATANVLMETPSSSIACALVAAGAGITLVGRLTAAYFAQSEVVIRPLKTEVITRYALIYPQTASRSPLAEIFATLLKEQASSPPS
jgi:DNA-binding transcriptional LysR family regulator